MIPLGAVAQDTISGFEGVVVCRSQWLHGCVRLTLQPQKMHEGQPVEAHTFDEPQLFMSTTPVEDEPTEDTEEDRAEPVRPGGPTPDPTRHDDPGR